MSDIDRVRRWAVTAMGEHLPWDEDEVAASLARCVDRYAGEGNATERVCSEAVDGVTAARATSMLPGDSGWWKGVGVAAADTLLSGDLTEASGMVGDFLAGEYDVDVDWNWPADRLFRVGCPNAPVGACFVVGDSGDHGSRAIGVIEARGDGTSGLVIVGGTWRPSADLWRTAYDEARAL